MKKKIYFVRHGESEGNAARVHQSKDTPLSEIGQSQAKMVALRFKNISVDQIIASPYTRARQTAQAIADYNDLEVEENALFQERRGPSELVGLSQLSEQSKQIRGALHQHLLEENGTWRYSDEESAVEFAARSKQALDFLQKRSENNLVVVSHALNIRMLLANVLDQTGELKHLYEIYSNFDLSNTSLSVITYGNDKARWQVDCINDHSHL
jgi:2,3-bisphosphoglycerate-dependent phosphoglycerate mutase